MIRLAPCLLTLVCAFSVGCVSNKPLQVGGVPDFILSGAEIADEPEPQVPDPAVPIYEDASGPVSFSLITDKRNYPSPKPEKKKSAYEPDPLERGRSYRIKRLVR